MTTAAEPPKEGKSKVHFSREAGLFEKPFALELQTEDKQATIRYTTDWNEPTASSGVAYAKPLNVTNTTIVRAALFQNGKRTSKVFTHSYLLFDQVIHQSKAPEEFPSGRAWNRMPSDYEMDPQVVNAPEYRDKMQEALRALPSVSIVLSQEDLFGPEKGIYLHTMEKGDAWEKPCSVEMILPGGQRAFEVDCGIRIQGNMNRFPQRSPKHSFRLLFREKYGSARLHYPMFPDSPLKKFDTLVLRADYNNSWIHWDAEARPRAQRTRDAWMKDTHRAMGWVAGHNRYVHLYLNGLYWGIYDFAERPDADFAAAYLGGTKLDYDVINDFQVKDGKMDAFSELASMAKLANNAQYERLKHSLDVTQYIDYVLLNYYCGNQDWGENKNWYAIHRRNPPGLFQYFVWDGEQILHDVDDNTVTSPYEVPFRLEKELETNAEYRLAFADRVQKHCFGQGALTPQSCAERWMKWAKQVDVAVIAESARWGDYRQKPAFTRNKEWIAEQTRLLKVYFPNRTEVLLKQLGSVGLFPPIPAPEVSLKAVSAPQVELKAPHGGKIYFTTDGTDPREYGTSQISSHATEYTGNARLIALDKGAVLKARALHRKTWSALTEFKM